MSINPATLSTVEVEKFLDRFEELLDDMRASLRPRSALGGGVFVLDDATSLRAKVESKVKTARTTIDQVRDRVRAAEQASSATWPEQREPETVLQQHQPETARLQRLDHRPPSV